MASSTRIVANEFVGMRLDAVLALVAGLPRRRARLMVEQGRVLVNQAVRTFPSHKVRAGDRLTWLADPVAETAPPREQVCVLHEDDFLLVVNKPPGLLTNRSGGESGAALTDLLAAKHGAVFPVHRLDRDTSGVCVFARRRDALERLFEDFRRRRVHKVYIGIVEGPFKPRKLTLRGRLRGTEEWGETQLRVLRRLRGATLVEFRPRTGRTHQIRLHLLAQGAHLVGEKRYCVPGTARIVFPRHALHARAISFVHPGTGKRVRYESPLPEDMARFVAQRLE